MYLGYLPYLSHLAYPGHRPRWLPAAGLAALAAVLWAVYIWPCPHFDIDVFLRAGMAVGDGRDPYPPVGTPEVYSGFAFVYPYLAAFPFVPLSALHPGGAEVFIAISMIAVFVGARLVGARSWRTYALVLAASCTITGLQMGTLGPLLFLGLAALWRVRDTPVAAGLLAALVVYSKLFLIPVFLFLLLTRRWAATACAAGALGLLFGIGEVVSPVQTHTYTQILSALAREGAPDGLSLTGLLMNVGLGLEPASRLAWVVALVLVAACWRAVRRGCQEHLLFAGTVAAALVASPIVWSHYLLVLAAPLLIVAQTGIGRVGARCVAAAGAGAGARPAADAAAGVEAGSGVEAGPAAGPAVPAEGTTTVTATATPTGTGPAAGPAVPAEAKATATATASATASAAVTATASVAVTATAAGTGPPYPGSPDPPPAPRDAAAGPEPATPAPVLPDAALAAFTVGSWLVVTPHLSQGPDTAAASAVLTVLAAPPLLAAASRLVHGPGGRGRAVRAGATTVAVGVAAVGACLGLRAAAVSPGAAARIVGAYCALLGVFAFLGWAWSRAQAGGHSGGRRPSPILHRMASRLPRTFSAQSQS